MKLKEKACRFAGICQLHSKKSGTCNSDDQASAYYGPGRAAGCYRYMIDLSRHLCPGCS